MASTHDELALQEIAFGPGLPEDPLQEPFKQDVAPPVSGSASRGLDPDPVAPVVTELANSLARSLVAVIRDLQKQDTGEFQELRVTVEQQQKKLETAIDGLLETKGRLDRLVETVSEQESASLAVKGKCEQLADVITSAQEGAKRQELAVATLQQRVQEVSDSVGSRLDACLDCLGRQEADLSALKSTVSEVSPRMAALVERLDRQAEAIRSICETQSHRNAALDELIDVLLRLKGTPVPTCTGA